MAIRRDSLSWRYPEIEPYRRDRLQVSALHNLYFEESGNPQGKPAVFVHGGPGGGTDSSHRRFFDPEHYRIILFDQRGCGQSTPHASLENNTTWDLVADMEALRAHLGIRSCSKRAWQLPSPRRCHGSFCETSKIVKNFQEFGHRIFSAI